MVALFGILDTMEFINAPISTICIGQAASAAAIVLAAGEKGRRFVLPNARVLLHQPHGGAQGQSSDIEIQVREMVELRNRMVDVLQVATGQDRERLVHDLDRDYILRGDDAVAYGVVDEVLGAAASADGLHRGHRACSLIAVRPARRPAARRYPPGNVHPGSTGITIIPSGSSPTSRLWWPTCRRRRRT